MGPMGVVGLTGVKGPPVSKNQSFKTGDVNIKKNPQSNSCFCFQGHQGQMGSRGAAGPKVAGN